MPRPVSAFRNLIVLAACCPLVAAAADWQRAASSENVTIYVDQESIARTQGKFRAWTLWDYRKPQKDKQKPEREFRSSRSLGLYDCGARTWADVRSAAYAASMARGKPLDEWQAPDPDKLQYKAVAANTVGEQVHQQVCRMAGMKFDKSPAKKK